MSADAPLTLAEAVRAGVVQGLARRAAAQQGEAKRLLLRRIETLRAEPAPASRRPAAAVSIEAVARRQTLASLSRLVDRLGRSVAASPHAVPKPLHAVTAFKATWAHLRADQRLRQALAQVPAMPGPLNSSHVVSQALRAMHALSPQYLDAVMSHVDALLWLEQASGGGELPLRPARRGGRRG